MVRSIESAIIILMEGDPTPDGAVTPLLVGCCVGICATICFCWARKGLVSTAGGGFLLCYTYFWTSTRQGQSLVKWSSLQARHGNFTFFFPLLPPVLGSLAFNSLYSVGAFFFCQLWFFLPLVWFDFDVWTKLTSMDWAKVVEFIVEAKGVGLSIMASCPNLPLLTISHP